MTFDINAQSRPAQGTGASRRLRKAGRLPAVVYGGSKDAVGVSLDHNEMYYTLQDEKFHTSLINLSIDGATEQVLLRAVQYHPFKQQVLHVDFQRVDNETKVEIKVPLHFTNADSSVGVKMQGGTVSYALNDVLVRVAASKVPDFVEVDLSKLEASHPNVHLSDLKLPEGAELVSLLRGNDLAVAILNKAKA
ncbi:50S ribosomal protein L25/general stress protein Ctc [Chitinilyticum piscinae]|uniref:Large ribosomal subunit protein bL25 n=1 Tax=Chitinilyticum piscinae TaxID=2866724 RepID=A0A8J7FGY1_9NEIS|nr:50S ribosomal protein L25/general stress protein Ctc [Chitinilyticum piscinae]MBE9609228.1 50S ribosomal protein L25/general stress protein Ctc [Chitinilyticum piscinae]